jgi:Uma2 family endonuclease
MAITKHGLTLDAFLKLPEEKPALEYLDGVVTQKVAPNVHHSWLQYRLAEWINAFAVPRRLAMAFPELRTTFAGASLVPDVAVVGWDHLPVDASGKLLEDYLAPPDVAVEIVSPEQSVAQLGRKCRWYLDHGVPLALIVHPRREWVRVYRPAEEPRTLSGSDVVDLGSVLPGFSFSVQALFELLHVR